MSTVLGRAVGMTDKGGELPPFDWAALVPLFVHPMRVAIVEALHWIGEPLSSTDLKRIFGDEPSVSFVAYHVRELAEVEAIVKVRSRQVRGAQEKFYFFPRQG
jgi:hypothetical protein